MPRTQKTQKRKIDKSKLKTLTVTREGVKEFVIKQLEAEGAIERICARFPSGKAEYWVRWNENDDTQLLELIFNEKP